MQSLTISSDLRAKEASQAWIEEFDRDGDETLSKKEYQGLFSAMMEDI